MADDYIDIPIVVDAASIYNNAVARIQQELNQPDWEPTGFLEILLRVCSDMAAVGAMVASDVPMSVFTAFGPLAKIPPTEATPATVMSKWTAIDNQGYTIPAGTPVGLSSAAAPTPVGFEVLYDTQINAGTTVVDNVQLVQTTPGTDGNNLNTVTRADSLGFIQSITLDAVTANGMDAEDPATYPSRLSQQLENWTDTPILGRDFARRTLTIPAVYRCAAIDNYNPADGTTNNEKMVAVCPVDASGNAVDAGTQAAVQSLLESLREVGFICNVVGPTQTAIDVSYTAQALPGADPSLLEANITAALNSYIFPGTWGDTSMPGTGQLPVWYNNPVLRLNKVIQAIENIQGLAFADPVEIAISGQPLASADINLPGAFPLPKIGVITGTVNPSA